MNLNAESILALAGTAFIGLLVVLMTNETRCLISGSDPMTDSIHDLSHRFPTLDVCAGRSGRAGPGTPVLDLRNGEA